METHILKKSDKWYYVGGASVWSEIRTMAVRFEYREDAVAARKFLRGVDSIVIVHIRESGLAKP